MNIGNITQIIGPVVDVKFDNVLPEIYSALTTDNNGALLTLEVAAHLGMHEVRTVAMSSTDGLVRGAEVIEIGRASCRERVCT